MPDRSTIKGPEGQSATKVANSPKPQKQPRKSAGFRTLNVPPSPPTNDRTHRRRRKVVKAAIGKLESVKLTSRQRRDFADRIERAPRPSQEAERLIAWAMQQQASTGDDAPDLSDIQELYVKLVRRDGGVWFPQNKMLADLERAVLDGIDRETFDAGAGAVWSLPQALPQSFLKSEGR